MIVESKKQFADMANLIKYCCAKTLVQTCPLYEGFFVGYIPEV